MARSSDHGMKYYSLTVHSETERSHRVRSLQNLCRSTVLECVTLQRIQQVVSLPLPTLLKEFLCTFSIPEDFNLDDLHLDYNFNFPNHLHHQTHQIHPGKCLLDDSKVLIKSEHTTDPCSMCNNVGNRTMVCGKTREKWLHVNHENLMKCHFGMVDNEAKMLCYVFDFPLINLQDFALRVFFARTRVPEYLVWEVLYKLSSVLIYLKKQGIIPWEICLPQHIVINERGEVKLENLLLYLPAKSGSHFQTEANCSQSMYLSPEASKCIPVGQHTVSWGLGCVLSVLTAPIPRVLLKMDHGYPLPLFSPTTDVCYSSKLNQLTKECLTPKLHCRPGLKKLHDIAQRNMTRLSESYKGPANILALIDNY